jgi:uncharacterized membrane protein
MNTRTSTLIVIILIALATIAGIALYNQLPESMASHWNFMGQADGFSSRLWGAFLSPLIAAGLYLLFLIIPEIDPLKVNIAKFRSMYNTFIVLVIGFMLYLHALTLVWNLGYRFEMGRMLTPGIGLILFFAGVLIGHSKRNWFIGIRTPWTLSNDKVWDETHRLGAVLFKVCGGFALLGSFLNFDDWWIILIPIILSVMVLIPYSFALYRRELKADG